MLSCLKMMMGMSVSSAAAAKSGEMKGAVGGSTSTAGMSKPSSPKFGPTFGPTFARTSPVYSLVCSLALVAVVLLAYNPVTRNGFVNYDDEGYIVRNAHVRAGLTWETVKWAFTTYDETNWHPLTWLSHALDVELFGLNPAGHHYMSVLMNGGCAVLLFLLLQSATGFRWRSLMVAALFALHPINVESVAWAAERKNVLSMLFFLLALFIYTSYARRPSVGRYVAVTVAFALALMAKPQVVTFPFLLLLWDYWPLGRVGGNRYSEAALAASAAKAAGENAGFIAALKRCATQIQSASVQNRSATTQNRSASTRNQSVSAAYTADSVAANIIPEPASPAPMPRGSIGWLVLEKVPWVGLAAGSSFLTMQAQRAGGSVKALSLYGLPLRVETAIISYVRYLGKAFWPADLVALYPHATKLYPAWEVVASAGLLGLITACAVAVRSRRYLLVGWLWFLGSLIPMIGLVQVGAQEMADRYAYIPFIGLFVMMVWLAGDCLSGAGTNRKVWRVTAAAISVTCLLVLGVATYRQVGYWHDTESFWRRTIALTENNYLAHDILGYYLTTQGRAEEGAAEFRDALAIRPEDPEANMSLGPYEEAHGHLAEAIEHYQNVAQYSARPELRATAFFNLGHAYRKMGDLTRAKQCFEMTLQMAPREPSAMIGLGLIAEAEGQPAEAASRFSQALAVKPDDVTSLLLARAFEEQGRGDEARAIVERVRLSPNYSEAQKIAALLLAGK